MFYEAREIFDDAKKYINPETDPVHWDLLNGLSELAMVSFRQGCMNFD